jgi:2-isopropylmalate synthase
MLVGHPEKGIRMPEFGPYYMPDKWCLDRYMYTEEVRSTLNLPEKFRVRDTTIREGDETPGLFMSPSDKLKISEKLYEAGVSEADVGYLGPAQEHFEAAKLIKKEIPDMRISGFARVWAADWKRDVDRCVEAGVAQIDVLQHPLLIWATDEQVAELGCPRNELIPRTVQVIEYAKSCGVEVAYGHPDASRTPWEILEEFYSVTARAGVDLLIIYEDGYGCPPGVKHLIKKIKTLVTVPLMIHCHDDVGLGTANVLAAVGEGAESADLVVNGLGDKGGLTKMEEVVVALECHYGLSTGVRLEKLYELSKFVEEITGVKRQINKPLVGENAYIHEAEIHAYCIIKGMWEAMEGVHPHVIGQERSVVFGGTTLHGEAARARLDALGLRFNSQDVESILNEIRKRLQTQPSVSLPEFDEIARSILDAEQ